MSRTPDVKAAAELFKLLGNESRLDLLLQLVDGPRNVATLASTVGITQPLTSQHLRTLRQCGLVAAERQGREVTYALADHHVQHMIVDALTHVAEPKHDLAAGDDTQITSNEGAPA